MPEYNYDLPQNYYFGGGGDTFAPPLALIILILAGLLILALPRKYVIIPFFFATLLVPLNVCVVVAALHFRANLLVLLPAVVRILARGEQYRDRWNALDKVIVYGILVGSVDYVLVWRDFGALVNRANALVTALGTYFVLRSLIRTKTDIVRVIKVLAVVVIIIAPLVWYEHRTQHNLFSVFGARELSDIREGRVRASGPFDHSIIAGSFGVVLVPLFVGLWWYKPRTRPMVVAAIASSTVMMLASASSTPVMSLPAGVLALLIWPWREKMRIVRRGIVAFLACLQVEMWVHSGAPVWFAIDRMSGFLGGSGWHRAMLIDNFVRHFFEWCLIGTNNNPNWGWSMWDVDNAFVGAGLKGGLLGLVLFTAIFVYAYRTIGQARKAAAKSRSDARLIWAIGAALFANTTAFFGIVFFDQSAIEWWLLLVMIQVTPTFALKERQPQPQLASDAAVRWDVYAEPAGAQALTQPYVEHC